MIADLRADSTRWRQEQRQTGSRGSSNSPLSCDMSGITVPDDLLDPYIGSRTYEESTASRATQSNSRRDGNSPSLEGPYGPPGQRMPQERSRVVEPMQIDQPGAANQRYGQPGGQPPGRGFPQDPRGFPENSRDYSRQQPGRPYQPDQVMSDAYVPPVTSPYGQESRYAPAYGQSNETVPPGYVRQGDYYVPVSSGFSQPGVMTGNRPEQPQYNTGYGQPPPQQYREARDHREREPRYGGPPEYQDPRNAYPSPAATVSTVAGRDREPITSPSQPRFAHRRLPSRVHS